MIPIRGSEAINATDRIGADTAVSALQVSSKPGVIVQPPETRCRNQQVVCPTRADCFDVANSLIASTRVISEIVPILTAGYVAASPSVKVHKSVVAFAHDGNRAVRGKLVLHGLLDSGDQREVGSRFGN